MRADTVAFEHPDRYSTAEITMMLAVPQGVSETMKRNIREMVELEQADRLKES